MKKVLFATSALVLTAGVAAAEVAVSGDGRMGVIYDGDDAQFSSRARVKFTLTGESDAGLSFGGSFRVDQENYNANAYRSAARGTAGAVWISGTYGKLSMGDVVSASEAAIGDLYEIGYTEGQFANDIEEITYLTGDGANLDQGPSILYEYTVNNISLYASASDGVNTVWYTTPGTNAHGDDTGDTAYSLAAKYDGSTWWAALSYAKHGDASEIGLGAEGKFNNFAVKGVYMSYDDRFDGLDEWKYTAGLAASYQADAVLVKGFWRQDKFDLFGGGTEKYDSFGIGADYDLGGGAVLAGGIIDTDYLDDTVVDMGIKFSF
ncbi:outer membrane protein OmpU [Paracoccus aminovorans]|uniref:Outer membrane protein OmpU n=1 Tax=Paracoccus aminovorans TaxID=34004 RepID=A0A1I3B4P5_9RHOB|nr:porin [Paracoccus aminovorans]CQR87541.1 porin family protein [Paracoccus aminovorans]SFH57285.1 outer membrane protein OmpU [Paracoccus aminovorans]